MKKFVRPFAIIGATAAIVLTASTGVRATEYPDGDANCSGTITMADANLVLATYLQKPGIPAVPGACGAAVDMNCSGSLTPADALIIQNIFLGLIESPEAC